MVSFPPAERTSLEAILTHYCRKRCPEHLHDRVKLTFRIEGLIVTLFERRPSFPDKTRWVECDVARFRYFKNRNQWALYWRDSKRRQGRHLYDRLRPNRSIEPLLAEVDKDPAGIFWG